MSTDTSTQFSRLYFEHLPTITRPHVESETATRRHACSYVPSHACFELHASMLHWSACRENGELALRDRLIAVRCGSTVAWAGRFGGGGWRVELQFQVQCHCAV